MVYLHIVWAQQVEKGSGGSHFPFLLAQHGQRHRARARVQVLSAASGELLWDCNSGCSRMGASHVDV